MKMPALLALVLLTACSTAQPETVDTIPHGGDRYTGVVRIVGSAPVNVHVVLQPQEGRALQLAGPLASELEQLSGAVVSVRGSVSPSPDPMMDRRIEVESYDIVSVDGQPVISGVVEGRMNDWTLLRTDAGELIYLTGPAETFRAGQKVWVQGPSARIVQSYGVITQ